MWFYADLKLTCVPELYSRPNFPGHLSTPRQIHCLSTICFWVSTCRGQVMPISCPCWCHSSELVVFLSPVFHHLPLLPPNMTDSSTTSNSIFAVVHMSLRLAGNLLDMLTMAHLHTLKDDLHVMLAIIHGQIQSKGFSTFTKNILKCLTTHSSFTDNHRMIIDMSDWENASDEEKEDKKEDAGEVGGMCLFLLNSVATHSWGSQVVEAKSDLICWLCPNALVQVLITPPHQS